VTAIGVVGAGAASAATAFALNRALDEVTVTVFEKSGGLGGRAATRRRDGVTYDYGANYVTADDEGVTDLLTETLDTAGLVDVTDPIYTFDAAGTVSPGRDADGHRFTYERGITQLAKRLFARSNATVHRDTRVTALRRDGDHWHVTAGGDRWGPFDALCLNPPAPQSAALLADAAWDAPLRADLVAALRDVAFRTCWTAVLHYPFRLERPYYALVNPEKTHDVGWVAREECKDGHVPEGESLLVVQAGHEWSLAHFDDPPAENAARLAASAADVLGDDRLREPDWTDHQGWRYAQTAGEAPTALLDAAEAHGLYFLGDWTVGTARVHAALRSGLDAAERLCRSH